MSKMREAFEKWLLDEQGLPCTWNESRNCYDEFPAHLAWKGYQAAIAAVKEGGPSCYMGTYNEHDIRDMRTVVMRHKESFESTPDRVDPLYKIDLE